MANCLICIRCGSCEEQKEIPGLITPQQALAAEKRLYKLIEKFQAENKRKLVS